MMIAPTRSRERTAREHQPHRLPAERHAAVKGETLIESPHTDLVAMAVRRSMKTTSTASTAMMSSP